LCKIYHKNRIRSRIERIESALMRRYRAEKPGLFNAGEVDLAAQPGGQLVLAIG
jgi:hypothetical protein